MQPYTFLRSLLAATAFVVATGTPLHAESNNWSTDAAGSWSTAGNWSGGVNIPGSTSSDNVDVATFDSALTADRIVTVDTRFIGGISFGNSSAFKYTLSGGTLNLNSGGVIQTLAGNGAHTDTISTPIKISGASAATASFTANATSASSILNIGAVTGSATAGNTTTLTLNGTNTGANTITGIIGNGSGGGNLAVTKSDAGSWTLSNGNTYTGGTTLNLGTLISSGTTALGTSASPLQLNGGLLDLAYNGGTSGYNTTVGGNVTIKANRVSGTGVLTHTLGSLNLGAFTLTATKDANDTRLAFGNWTIANGSVIDSIGGATGLVQLGALQTTNSTANYTLKSSDVAGGLIRLNANAAGARTGTTTIDMGSNGIVQYFAANPLGTGSALSLNSGRLNVSTTATITPGYNTSVTGNSAIYLNTGATTSMTLGTLSIGSQTFTAGVYNNSAVAGALTFGATTLTGNATFDVANDVGSNGIMTLNLGAVSGSGFGITKTGAGILRLNGTGSFNGLTTVSAGTLTAGVANAIGTGDVTVNGSTAIYSLGTNSDSVGTVTLDGGGQINSSSGILTSTGTFEMKSGSASAILNGGVALNKTTSGTVTLTGVNTYTGVTTISSGTLALSGSGSIANSSVIQMNASTTFNVTATGGIVTLGANQTLAGTGSVVATGKTVIANGTISPGNSPGTMTLDGGNIRLGVGGDANMQVFDADGAAGVGYDTVSLVNGATLDLSLLSVGNEYNINLWSLSGIGPDVNGAATNFDNTLNYAWTLFDTGTAISGFSADKFLVNLGAFNGTDGFDNALGGGAFSVGLADGNTNLVVNFTAVPEPSAALLGGISILLLLRRRR